MAKKQCANCEVSIVPWADFCTLGCVGAYAAKVGKTETEVLREFREGRRG